MHMLILIAFQSDFADVSRSTARIELALFSDLNAGKHRSHRAGFSAAPNFRSTARIELALFSYVLVRSIARIEPALFYDGGVESTCTCFSMFCEFCHHGLNNK